MVFFINFFRYNLNDTVKAIQDFLSHDPTPPQTARTAEAADEYDSKLMEAAKQQSRQEMVHVALLSDMSRTL